MAEMDEKIVKEHLNNLVNALVALAPTRNYITQFLMVADEQDYPTMYEAYPELLKDEKMRKSLEKLFGTTFGSRVKIGYGKGREIISFINDIFTWFDEEDFREELSLMLKDVRQGDIPNLKREWVKSLLSGASNEPTYGDKSVKILKAMLKVNEEERCVSADVSFSELYNRTNIVEHELRRTIEFLENKMKLVESRPNDNVRMKDILSSHQDLIVELFGE